MEYIRSCNQDEKLKSTSVAGDDSASKVQILVIGHGSHEGIPRYKEMSDCVFDMYSDEDKKIYSSLGLTRRFLGDTPNTTRASYVPEDKSTLSMTLYSAYKMIASGTQAFKGGEFALLGGEFVFEGGE